MLHTVLAGHLLPPGAVVAVGASGGKDSTVLAHVLRELAPRLGITLHLVAVDEGIGGYRDAALEAVRSQAARWELPLTIVAYADLFGGWTMDAVARSTAGSGRSRSCCTFCGVLRRRALEEGARLVGATHIVTGESSCGKVACKEVHESGGWVVFPPPSLLGFQRFPRTFLFSLSSGCSDTPSPTPPLFWSPVSVIPFSILSLARIYRQLLSSFCWSRGFWPTFPLFPSTGSPHSPPSVNARPGASWMASIQACRVWLVARASVCCSSGKCAPAAGSQGIPHIHNKSHASNLLRGTQEDGSPCPVRSSCEPSSRQAYSFGGRSWSKVKISPR